jgi:ribose-phosphate pyrophosphokinase
MELTGRKRLMLFSGSANEPLAEEVAGLLGIELGSVTRATFPNGETYVRFDESVRGADAFIIQSHSAPINHHIMEQLLMLDALERASAKRKTAVVPYFGYSRQDRKSKAREPISARLVGDLLTRAGADRIVSMDLHSQQIQGFVAKPFDHLTALPVLKDYLQSTREGPLVIVSPDTGRVRVASKYARHLDADVAFVHKRRSADQHGAVDALQVVGDVRGKHAVIVDDMIDTAGTVVAAADLLKDAGAVSIRAMATHGVLSPPAGDRIKNSPLEEVVITNTLPVPDAVAGLPGLKVLSIASIIADALKAIFADASVSRIFEGENAF